jgi:benzodiazapine receptor
MSNRIATQAAGLLLWLAITAAAAVLGSIASLQAEDFYRQLQRPDWAPPAWIFGPVWTTLYVLMAIAAWLVWRERRNRSVRPALTLYVLQLGCNALWSWLFFAWHRGLLAFADIVVLWCLILATLIAFWRVRRLAGMLLVPYLVWVSFAALLNLRVWQLNPGLLG